MPVARKSIATRAPAQWHVVIERIFQMVDGIGGVPKVRQLASLPWPGCNSLAVSSPLLLLLDDSWRGIPFGHEIPTFWPHGALNPGLFVWRDAQPVQMAG